MSNKNKNILNPSGVAGAPEIPVTPAMIEAGIAVYLGFCPDTGAGDAADRQMVCEIFQVMEAKSRN
jgi:hypothetical protein